MVWLEQKYDRPREWSTPFTDTSGGKEANRAEKDERLTHYLLDPSASDLGIEDLARLMLRALQRYSGRIFTFG